MNLSGQSLLVILIVGVIAGWLAGWPTRPWSRVWNYRRSDYRNYRRLYRKLVATKTGDSSRRRHCERNRQCNDRGRCATAYHKACGRWHWLGSSMVIDEGLDQRTPLLH